MGIFSSQPPKGKLTQKIRKSSMHLSSVEKQGHVKSYGESHSVRKTSRHVNRRKSY